MRNIFKKAVSFVLVFLLAVTLIPMGMTAKKVSAATNTYEFNPAKLQNDGKLVPGKADEYNVEEGHFFVDGYFKSVGDNLYKTKGSDIFAFMIGKQMTGSLDFIVNGTADVVLGVASTGGSNESEVAIIDEQGNIVPNAEGLTFVTGTDETKLTYTGLKSGKYRIVSPAPADSVTNRNRGYRILSLVVTETSTADRAPRADWASVSEPLVGEIVQKDGDILVTYMMPISYDGADKVTVIMTDGEGNEVDSKSFAADSDQATLSFSPKSSGNYIFAVNAIREGFDAKTVVSEAFAFTVPLDKAEFKSISNGGEGSANLEWEAVNEADSYNVYYRDFGAADWKTAYEKIDALKAKITGLTVGNSYEFMVSANRGQETGAPSDIGKLTASAELQRVWSFSAFGTSTSTKDCTYVGDASDGMVMVSSLNGKGKLVPASTDGLAFYYTTIDAAKENFILSADVMVNQWTYSNGQDGFGLAAMDAVGKNGDSTSFWNNSYMAVVTKVEYRYDGETGVVSDANGSGTKTNMKLGIGAQEKIGVTAENIADDTITSNVTELFSSTMKTLETSKKGESGNFNIIGNFKGNEPEGTVAKSDLLTTFHFTIQRDNTGYTISYTDKNGKENSVLYYDIERDNLTQIDKENIYIGFFAARNAQITVQNIELVTSDPATDAPAKEREAEKRDIKVVSISAEKTGRSNVDLNLISNADGVITIKDSKNNVIAENLKVVANEYITVNVGLKDGSNIFDYSFTPDPNFVFGEYLVPTNYDKVNGSVSVFRKTFGQQNIYVSPDVEIGSGVARRGTKEFPTDLQTALQYVGEGQTIIMLGGEYICEQALKVERGNSGTAEKPIYLIADPESTTRPVINFNKLGSGINFGGDYWVIAGFDVTNSSNGNKGMQISGSNNLVQDINAYNNGNTGIQISRYSSHDSSIKYWPSNNLILNCTSYNNADVGYEDADGFAAKLTVGEGNVFDGCISHHNADDGWDLYAKVETGGIGAVTIKNCVAYANGYLVDGTVAGNGNGFKMGGESISGYHTIIDSVSFDNKAKGVDSNSCPDIQVYNTTSFNNGGSNFAFYTNNAANTDFKSENAVSFRTKNTDVTETIKFKGTQDESKVNNATNYFWDGSASANTAGATVTDKWFESLDTSKIPTRNADGTINMNGLLVLTSSATKGIGATVAGQANKEFAGVIAAGENVTVDTGVVENNNTSEGGNTSTDDSNVSAGDDNQSQTAEKNNTVAIVMGIVACCVAVIVAVVVVVTLKRKKNK